MATPPFATCRAMVTPIEWLKMFTFYALVYAKTASTKALIAITNYFLWYKVDDKSMLAGPHVVV